MRWLRAAGRVIVLVLLDEAVRAGSVQCGHPAAVCYPDNDPNVFYDPSCISGGLGCAALGKRCCRFCEKGPWQEVQCPSGTAAPGTTTVATTVDPGIARCGHGPELCRATTAQTGFNYYTTTECIGENIGCNANGNPCCRFCGHSIYSSIPCLTTSTVTTFTQTDTTTTLETTQTPTSTTKTATHTTIMRTTTTATLTTTRPTTRTATTHTTTETRTSVTTASTVTTEAPTETDTTVATTTTVTSEMSTETSAVVTVTGAETDTSTGTTTPVTTATTAMTTSTATATTGIQATTSTTTTGVATTGTASTSTMEGTTTDDAVTETSTMPIVTATETDTGTSDTSAPESATSTASTATTAEMSTGTSVTAATTTVRETTTETSPTTTETATATASGTTTVVTSSSSATTPTTLTTSATDTATATTATSATTMSATTMSATTATTSGTATSGTTTGTATDTLTTDSSTASTTTRSTTWTGSSPEREPTLTIVTGTFWLTVGNATLFAEEPSVKTALQTGIAEAITGVDSDQVRIISVTVVQRRRLKGAQPGHRRLQTPNIRVDYEIVTPTELKASDIVASEDQVTVKLNEELTGAPPELTVENLRMDYPEVETIKVSTTQAPVDTSDSADPPDDSAGMNFMLGISIGVSVAVLCCILAIIICVLRGGCQTNDNDNIPSELSQQSTRHSLSSIWSRGASSRRHGGDRSERQPGRTPDSSSVGTSRTGLPPSGAGTPRTPRPGETNEVLPPIDDTPPAPAPSTAPTYWKRQDMSGSPFCHRERIRSDEKDVLQRMMNETFKPVATRDRKGNPPERLVITAVERVENNVLWTRYLREKERVKGKRSHPCTPLKDVQGGVALTAGEAFPLPGKLDKKVNEVYLFHGTSPNFAFNITQEGFNLKHAGAGAGSMFGPGVYFAECSSKSDEYASADVSGGIYCMLLCRVVLGEVIPMTQGGERVHKMVEETMNTGLYDSVLGDRKAAVGTYREFVVFDEGKAYPEYVLLYKREFR